MSNDPNNKQALSLKTYRAATKMLGPLVDYTLKKRLQKGKEDPERVTERRGIAGVPRPEGMLIWVHGASVGESLSILPLVKRLTELHPSFHFLVTTGTVTSAQLMAARLPANAIHQFAPLDHPSYVRAFLTHWRPDASIFVESELWPNLIQMTSEQNIPMALVNGRVSPKSYKSWQQRPKAINSLLASFDILLAQDRQNQSRLTELAGRDVSMFGNLKLAAPALPVGQDALKDLKDAIGDRPVWLAASTHPGEEEIIVETHKEARKQYPNLLTIIAPRHPERGDELDLMLADEGLVAARRSVHEKISRATEIYLADTLGELGVFYTLSDIAFVGGSLLEIGGHNPLEPARLKSSIMYGPHIFNFLETYQDMRASGGTALVRNAGDLTASLIRLLTDDMTRNAMAERAQEWANDNAEEILVKIVDALSSVLPTDEKVS